MEMSDKKNGATPLTISLSFDSKSINSYPNITRSLEIIEPNSTCGEECLTSINEAGIKMEEDEKVCTKYVFQEARIFKKAGAEIVSTFILVFAGCGAIMVNAKDTVLTHLGVCVVFGLAVMAMLYTVGHISGGHMNPAVSVAFSSVGQLPLKELPIYVAAQTVGAVLAAASLKYILGNMYSVSFAATVPPHVFQSLAMEFILTFVFLLVASAMVTDAKAVGSFTGVALGGTIAMNALFAGPVTGASMNPARSLGAALISGKYEGLWVYAVGPTLGAVCGAWVYRAIHLHN